MKITIIGAGNIGSAITGGLLHSKMIKASDLTVADINQESLKSIQKINSEIAVSSNNIEAVESAEMIILAVKPWLIQPVLSEISKLLKDNTILVSIAAGIDFEFINNSVSKEYTAFRVMPNTAISIGESMTLIAAQNASKEQEKYLLDIFSKLGKAMIIPEKMMGAATSVASCGIAYALRYLRASTEGAVELGFTADVASKVVAQTMKGAAELILTNNSHPEEEIDKVTTPGGWTINGLNELEANGFTNAVIKGLKANAKK